MTLERHRSTLLTRALIRLLAVLVLLGACAPPDGNQPASSGDSPSSGQPHAAVEPLLVNRDSVSIEKWYSARNEKVAHWIVADSFRYVAVAEPPQSPGSRTRVDLWTIPAGAAPAAKSAAAEGAWIDTLFVVRSDPGQTPILVAAAAYEDATSAVQFIRKNAVLEPIGLETPGADERYNPVEYHVSLGSGGMACAIRVRFSDELEEQPDVTFWYVGSANRLIRVEGVPTCDSGQ